MAEQDRTLMGPEAPDAPKVGTPEKVAAGIPAIRHALGHMLDAMGPVQAFQTLGKLNQQDGFDCPGCAWPDPDDKRALLAEYCENGAKAVAEEATVKRVDPAFFARYSIAQLQQATDYWLGKQGRLTHPMLLKKGASHYEPIEWEDAFSLIAGRLKSLENPDRAVFYTSGRTSNEAAFLYQLMVRMYGTNNLPDCSNMCHESSGQGLSQTVGIGKGSVTLEDIHEAEVVMVVGQNPGTNHPRMLSALQKCKTNGGKIISVNPLPEAGLMGFKHPQKPGQWLGKGTSLSDIFLQVKVGADLHLAKALMRLLLEAEEEAPGRVLDQAFMNEKTVGFAELKQDLLNQDWNALVSSSGVGEADIRAAAGLLIKHQKIIICWAMGLTQHKHGVANIQEMVNILLMKGAIGKPGAGTCPVRGHSNVQGDRTMGIWEKPREAFLDTLEEKFSFSAPRHHGYDVVHAIEAMHAGKVDVFLAMGGNFLSAAPDTLYTADALEQCKLTIQISTKLNRSHIVTGETALILPCLGRTEIDSQEGGEQFVTVENSMGKVHKSQGNLAPASTELKSEPAIVTGISAALFGEESKLDWPQLVEDYDRIRDLIEACIPGFDQYNTRVRQPSGFYLPNGAREGRFNTPDGKAHFTVNALPNLTVPPGRLVLMTLRSHDQYNTTLYGLDDRYRGIKGGRRVLLMHEADIRALGLEAEQLVDVRSFFGDEIRLGRNFRVIPYPISKGCIASYFPEANVLVPIGSKADGSHTPTSKWVEVEITPAKL